MKTKSAHTKVGLFLASLLTITATTSATIYDLNADWSDAINPNGVWTYRQGTTALPHVNAWQGLSGDFATSTTGLGALRYGVIEPSHLAEKFGGGQHHSRLANR